MPAPEPPVRLTRLLAIERGVVGGLVAERATKAWATANDRDRDTDLIVRSAVHEGLEAALGGRRPAELVERLPAWVVAPLRARLRDHELWWLGDDFVVVRTLEVLGLTELEVDDDYVMSMLTGLVSAWSWEDQVWGDPVEWFRHDRDLVERAYWRAYEIEGQGVVSLRAHSSSPSTSWRVATARMIDEAMITRERVISSCFAALDRDFSPAASQWFVEMLGDLALTDDELAAHQAEIRRQLSHASPGVVRNALAWATRLDRGGLLEDEPAAASLEAGVLAPTKVAALAALRLLRNIHTRDASIDVVTAARAGLTHRHLDVQRTAAALLRVAGAADVLAAEADLIRPSLRAELGLLAPAEIGPGAPEPPDDGVAPESLPVTRPVARRDVAERLAALMEHATDPYELELVLDDLARVGPTDRLRPLVKRARTILAANEYHRLEQQLAALVLASTGETADPSVPEPTWSRFLHRRIDDVKQVLAGRAVPSARLATPTSPDGRLDPETFVDRVLRADAEVLHVDLLAALLRLGSEGRPGALRTWESRSPALSPAIDQAVRYALGGEPAVATTISDAALWVAASRSRAALADDPLLIAKGLDGPGQGRALHPSVAFLPNSGPRHFLDDTTEPELTVTYRHAAASDDSAGGVSSPAAADPSTAAVTPAAGRARRSPRDLYQPTSVRDLNTHDAGVHGDAGWLDSTWLAWLATLWPADAEHYARAAVRPVYVSRHWTATDSTAEDALTALRRHPGRLGPTSVTIIALAMTAATAHARVHAADAVVDLAGRGRVAPRDLGLALASSAPAATITRWHDTLERVAAAGRSDLTIEVIGVLLPELPRAQRGLHALLDLLHQELVRTGARAVDPALRQYLSTISGTSKAAASARAVLAL